MEATEAQQIMLKYNLFVIDGESTGYVGSLRAGQLSKTVICGERERAGDTPA